MAFLILFLHSSFSFKNEFSFIPKLQPGLLILCGKLNNLAKSMLERYDRRCWRCLNRTNPPTADKIRGRRTKLPKNLGHLQIRGDNGRKSEDTGD